MASQQGLLAASGEGTAGGDSRPKGTGWARLAPWPASWSARWGAAGEPQSWRCSSSLRRFLRPRAGGRGGCAAARLSSLARRRGTCSPGDARPRSDLRGGGPGPGCGLPRVTLRARAVWANSRPSCGASVSASSAANLLQRRSSASWLPVFTARGSARSCEHRRAGQASSQARYTLLRAPTNPLELYTALPPQERPAQSGVTPPASLGHE